jgi:hypothetical protein
VRVATSISNPWYNSNFEDPAFGNDRYGPELAITVDPKDVNRIYLVYATGTSAADETLHLRWSSDGGQNWFGDVRTIPKAKNPSLAINALGMVGFVYQQVVGANWTTVLEVSEDGFVSSFTSHILASTPTNAPTPASVMATYLGDYIKLQAHFVDFYGIFSASNAANKANFPSGVTYQRNVNWATQTLLANDGVTPVAVSIDPFFFKLKVALAEVATAIADSGFFGDVCLGSFKDEMLTINGRGSATLKISNITSTSVDFEPPSVVSYPLKVEAGDSIEVMIRFKPTDHNHVPLAAGRRRGACSVVRVKCAVNRPAVVDRRPRRRHGVGKAHIEAVRRRRRRHGRVEEHVDCRVGAVGVIADV